MSSIRHQSMPRNVSVLDSEFIFSSLFLCLTLYISEATSEATASAEYPQQNSDADGWKNPNCEKLENILISFKHENKFKIKYDIHWFGAFDIRCATILVSIIPF